jgi:hypothetical protein
MPQWHIATAELQDVPVIHEMITDHLGLEHEVVATEFRLRGEALHTLADKQ